MKDWNGRKAAHPERYSLSASQTASFDDDAELDSSSESTIPLLDLSSATATRERRADTESSSMTDEQFMQIKSTRMISELNQLGKERLGEDLKSYRGNQLKHYKERLESVANKIFSHDASKMVKAFKRAALKKVFRFPGVIWIILGALVSGGLVALSVLAARGYLFKAVVENVVIGSAFPASNVGVSGMSTFLSASTAPIAPMAIATCIICAIAATVLVLLTYIYMRRTYQANIQSIQSKLSSLNLRQNLTWNKVIKDLQALGFRFSHDVVHYFDASMDAIATAETPISFKPDGEPDAEQSQESLVNTELYTESNADTLAPQLQPGSSPSSEVIKVL